MPRLNILRLMGKGGNSGGAPRHSRVDGRIRSFGAGPSFLEKGWKSRRKRSRPGGENRKANGISLNTTTKKGESYFADIAVGKRKGVSNRSKAGEEKAATSRLFFYEIQEEKSIHHRRNPTLTLSRKKKTKGDESALTSHKGGEERKNLSHYQEEKERRKKHMASTIPA